MAIEYNNIILNVSKKPSPKCLLVSIPMYMYRIETNEFSHGLNFFQKTVLKFKAKPGFKDETIAEYLGFDLKLISIVTSELMSEKLGRLINEHGSLSENGKQKLNEIDGLIINTDKSKRKIGYIFQFVNQNKLYQYYINKLVQADFIDEEKNFFPLIITGTKGDGEDYKEKVTPVDELLRAKISLPQPSEREIIKLIQNTNKNEKQADEDDLKIQKITSNLAINYLNDQPEIYWICTYIYLHQNEDKLFEPDWRIMDPFGYGDNVSLKFYLNSPANKKFLEYINKKFADAKTIGGSLFSNYQKQLGKLIEDKILTDFSFGITQLDYNLQQYLTVIIKNYILQQNQNFNDLESSVSFSLNLQNALENILKQDKEKRKKVYDLVYSNLDPDPSEKRNELINIFRKRIFTTDTQVPQPLINACKGNLVRGNSLLSYMVSFILSYKYDHKSTLFMVFKNRIEELIRVAQLRNEKGHGQTFREKELKPLTKEEVEKYYSFIKSLINDYIKYF